MLKTFLPLFAMTFFIVLFIVLMQFLWKYIDDLVGKGLSLSVLGELFFYAALSMVPMALPLAILLASLMTFGNLGEKFELTAMKASGISLIQVMKPLAITVGFIAVGAFFFQNDVLPRAQVKMWTLLFSARQKSPELEIPESVFYDQIPGYNLYVKHKDRETGRLYGVTIYDVSTGGENSSIITADSAQMAMAPGNEFLYLHLWHGEQFENLRNQTRSISQNIPFRRETFLDKQVLIPFDANFNRLDEEGMRRQYVGKNISQLRATMDSVAGQIDSIGHEYAGDIHASAFSTTTISYDALERARPVSIDSVLRQLTPSQQSEIYNSALAISKRKQMELSFRAQSMSDEKKSYRRHEIELIKKFTLSVACLIMFFIGAPLGAIIRKGGLGTPLVISVILFLVYYIIDNTGYKMARDGHITVWVGMWLSTFILGPLGIYVTWKAMNDSAVFDKDRYMEWLRRLIGARQQRIVAPKEVIINDIDDSEAERMLQDLIAQSEYLESQMAKKPKFMEYLYSGLGVDGVGTLSQMVEDTVAYLNDSRDALVVNKLSDYPVLRKLWIYHPFRKRWQSIAAAVVFPVGVGLYLFAVTRARKELLTDLKDIEKRSEDILALGGRL